MQRKPKNSLDSILLATVIYTTLSGCTTQGYYEKQDNLPRYDAPDFQHQLIIPPGMLVDPKLKLITPAIRSQYL